MPRTSRVKREILELTVSHDGQDWIACNQDMVIRGKDFAEIDSTLIRKVTQSKQYPSGTELRVHMGFDYDSIPRWIRQYAAHYFNRHLTITL